MYKLLGILIIICGVCLGLYLGFYVCLYGGIVMAINGTKQMPVNASDVAFGLIKIMMCAGVVGVCSFLLVTICGAAVYGYSPRAKHILRNPWDRNFGDRF